MRKARRNLFLAVLLGLMALSTIATALPAAAASTPPTTAFQPLGGIHRG